ncbi:uncharacterized protein LOC133190906 isoform X2 [Saccostrea echinata]|uniref:uncharacterized protein LOC133190906 isoform X2 n=1 Tax=Saccostrea echinata TaxID=191078 RepID=UPI002A8186D3|nr:uncharacterized protein LOC133190906 isoform X2 [Saccostrea echinata]
MKVFNIFALYSIIIIIPFSTGLFDTQRKLFRTHHSQGNNLNIKKKSGEFSNPFGNRQEDKKQELLQRNILNDPNSPDIAKKTNNVRRKFTSSKFWLTSRFGNIGRGEKAESNKEPPQNQGSHSNPFSNQIKRQNIVPQITESKANTVEPEADQRNDIEPEVIKTNAGKSESVVPETGIHVGGEPNAVRESDFEFGGENHFVPCQWGGCISDFKCMRFANGRAIVCQEDSTETCQCMRANHESSSWKVFVPETKNKGGDPLDVPDNMEVGEESLKGLPCQYVGCLEKSFKCMTIVKGQPTLCNTESGDICQCLRKKSVNKIRGIPAFSRDPFPSSSALIPNVMDTEDAIPCQFWGCEPGHECLLVVDGQKTKCPPNTNAVCSCVRSIMG